MMTTKIYDASRITKIKYSSEGIFSESYLVTQYLPGDWLWDFLAENILCDKNPVHLFPWKQTFHLDCTKF